MKLFGIQVPLTKKIPLESPVGTDQMAPGVRRDPNDIDADLSLVRENMGSIPGLYPEDQFQLLENEKITPEELSEQLLSRKLDLWSGLELQFLNPDRFLREKRKTLIFYDTMLLDDRIKSVIDLKKRSILAVPYNIESASDSEQDKEIAEEIKFQLENLSLGEYHLSFRDVLDNFLDAPYYGFKCAEKVYQIDTREDGSRYYRLTAIKHRHSVFFDFVYDEFKNLAGVWVGRFYGQQLIVTGEKFKKKFMLFVHPYPKDGNMYGHSDLQEIYPQYKAKIRIFNYRNEKLEGFGKPIPVATYVANEISSGEKDALDEQLTYFQNNKFFNIPGKRLQSGEISGKIKLDFANLTRPATAGGDDYTQALNQLDTQIARKLLVPDKLGMSDSDGGSYSLGEIQHDVYLDGIKLSHSKIEELVNSLIVEIVDMNYTGIKEYPKMKFDEIDEKLSADNLMKLVEAGLVDPREKWVRRFVGVPTISEKEKEELDNNPLTISAPKTKPGDPVLPGNAPSPYVDKGQNADEATPVEKPAPTTAKFKSKNPPINFKEVKADLDGAENEFVTLFLKLQSEAADAMVKQIQNKKIIENKDLEAINALRIPKGDIRTALQGFLVKSYLMGKGQAVKEIRPRFKGLDLKVNLKAKLKQVTIADYEDFLGQDFIRKWLEQYGDEAGLTGDDIAELSDLKQNGFFITGDLESDMVKKAYYAIVEGFKAGELAANIVASVQEALTEDREQYATTIVRTNESTAYNAGRQNFFLQEGVQENIEAYEYSAIIDDATTEFCQEHNGQIILKTDPDYLRIQPPNHYNCRSLMIPIFVGDNELKDGPYEGWQEDGETWNDGVDKDQRFPASGFGKPAGF